MATLLEKIERGLKNGIVTFRFRKLDGSIRVAVGTLQKDILATKPIRKSDGSSSPMVQVFWDLEKDAWRSFQKGTEIDIISFATIEGLEIHTTDTTERPHEDEMTFGGDGEIVYGEDTTKRPTSKFGEGMTDGLDIGKALEKIFSVAMGGVPMGVAMGGGVPTKTETTKTETTTDLRRKIGEVLGRIDVVRNELGNIEDCLKEIYHTM